MLGLIDKALYTTQHMLGVTNKPVDDKTFMYQMPIRPPSPRRVLPHTHAHTHGNTRAHTLAHTHAHAHARAHTHTHTRPHAPNFPFPPPHTILTHLYPTTHQRHVLPVHNNRYTTTHPSRPPTHKPYPPHTILTHLYPTTHHRHVLPGTQQLTRPAPPRALPLIRHHLPL